MKIEKNSQNLTHKQKRAIQECGRGIRGLVSIEYCNTGYVRFYVDTPHGVGCQIYKLSDLEQGDYN